MVNQLGPRTIFSWVVMQDKLFCGFVTFAVTFIALAEAVANQSLLFVQYTGSTTEHSRVAVVNGKAVSFL